jgi:hypothetical protein
VVHVGVTAEKERLPFPISGAVVNLFEEDEYAGIYIEDDTRPGKYILENYSGTPGKMYHVEVVLPDNRIYKSVPEKMPDDSGSLSTYYKFAREEFIDHEGLQVPQNFVKIFANSILPNQSNRFIMWTVDEVFIIFGGNSGPCFVTQNADPQFVVTLDRQYLLAKEYPDQFLASRLVDYTFMFRHYFVTHQTSLTGQAFDYWTKVKILAGQNGSLFDTPPAIISGNISNTQDKLERVWGYFQVVHQTLDRVLLTKDDFPYALTFTDCFTTGSSSSPPPARCIDCLSVANSSHVRPPWF